MFHFRTFSRIGSHLRFPFKAWVRARQDLKMDESSNYVEPILEVATLLEAGSELDRVGTMLTSFADLARSDGSIVGTESYSDEDSAEDVRAMHNSVVWYRIDACKSLSLSRELIHARICR